MNLAGQLWAWEFEGWKPEIDVLEDRVLHPRRAVQAADRLPRSRRQGVLLLDPRQQPGELPGRLDEARDLLQRGRAADRPRDPPAQRRARVPLLRRTPVAALQAHELGRAATTSRWSRRRGTCSRSPARRRWRRWSARPANPCATSQFLRFRDAKIDGTTVEVGRIGMSGNLAYELRGPIEDGPAIYDAVVKAGKDLGIQRLGWRTYLVNHVEGGFPQMTWQFQSAADLDPGYMAMVARQRLQPAAQRLRQRRPRRHARTPAHPGGGRLAARSEVRPRLHRARRAGGGGRQPEADRSRRCAGTPTTSSTSTPPCCSPARSTRPSTSPRHRRGRRA